MCVEAVTCVLTNGRLCVGCGWFGVYFCAPIWQSMHLDAIHPAPMHTPCAQLNCIHCMCVCRAAPRSLHCIPKCINKKIENKRPKAKIAREKMRKLNWKMRWIHFRISPNAHRRDFFLAHARTPNYVIIIFRINVWLVRWEYVCMAGRHVYEFDWGGRNCRGKKNNNI